MRLLLVGCGKLGVALLESFVLHKSFSSIVVVQPSLSVKDSFLAINTVTFVARIESIPQNFTPNIVILAIKPQKITEALSSYNQYTNSVFISLLAGVSIDKLRSYLPTVKNIVRIMPNLAISVSESLNFAYIEPSSNIDVSEVKSTVDEIFAKTGVFIWLDNEQFIDILTPISGSGPAYFFFLAEILINITKGLGLPEVDAILTVRQTLLGAALLANQSMDFVALKQAVASKGGVTEAALKVLENKLPLLMDEACEAAAKRLKELQT